MISLFFTILRSVAIPYVAYLFLKNTGLGDKDALLAIGIALLATNLISTFWNIVKIIPNALLLRGHSIFYLILRIFIELVSVAVVWYIYLSKYTNTFK